MRASGTRGHSKFKVDRPTVEIFSMGIPLLKGPQTLDEKHYLCLKTAF